MGRIERQLSIVLLLLASFLTVVPALASEGHGEEEIGHDEDPKGFDAGKMIMHHVLDAHEWELSENIVIPLPVILYDLEIGELSVFSSSHLGRGGVHEGYTLDEHHHIAHTRAHEFIDLSITKNVASMLLSAVILLVVFLSVAQGYKKNKNSAPKGIQSFFEPIIVYIRDEIARPNIGPKYERFMPFLLTVFFYIWFNNMLGLLPGAANVTGNIAVTMVLALFTFLYTLFNSNKHYWGHIFNTPGVPAFLKIIPIMPLVEFIGIFTKPFSLMLRLFANITAGHIIILSLLSLIFIFESVVMGVVSSLFATVMNMLELFVALLQAYVFTLLSALYFGDAVAEHHHAEHEGEEEHAMIG